jgi:condensin-2 complex subunit H2
LLALPQLSSDLAQNWNIDVARDLEEYLTELESISISFDGGKTNVNFAEAALLIQVGSPPSPV